MNEHELLEIIKNKYTAILSSKLTGIYIHGSLAFGCFNRERSDIDFLVVVSNPLSQSEKEALISALLDLNEYSPHKGFEMSVIQEHACSPFIYPTPYELHFSNTYIEKFRTDISAQCAAMSGTDRDLAAHITVIREVGITLCGRPINMTFSPVPREAYIDSILHDINDASENISRDPTYYVLNLCRVLAYLTNGIVVSKQQGGEWGLLHFPEYSELIASALDAYDHGISHYHHDILMDFANDSIALITALLNTEENKE